MFYFIISLFIFSTAIFIYALSKIKKMESKQSSDGDIEKEYGTTKGYDVQKAIKEDPNNPKHYFNMARVYFSQSQDEKALPYFQKAKLLGMNDIDLFVQYSSSLRVLKRHEEAQAVLEEGLKIYPDNPDLTQYLASTWYELGRKEEALELYARGKELEKKEEIDLLTESVRENPEDIFTHFRLAEAYVEEDEYDQAVAIIASLYDSGSRNKETFIVYTHILLDKGDFAEALVRCEEGLERYPENDTLNGARAQLLAELGRDEEAEKAFLKTIALVSPQESALIRSDYANFLGSVKRYEEAVKYYLEAIEIDPEDELTIANYACTLSRMGKHTEAIYMFGKVKDENTFWLIHSVAWYKSLLALGKDEEAKNMMDNIKKIYDEVNIQEIMEVE